MDGAIEGVVLRKNEENNEGHVYMMRISVLHVVKDLEDGQHLRGRVGEQKEGLSMCVGVVSEMTFMTSLLQDFRLWEDAPQCVHLSKDKISRVLARHVHTLLDYWAV